MIVSFDRLPEQLVSGFKGGDGVVSVRAYDDDMGRILQLTVPVGGSIGPHTHTDNCEVMCIVSGTGLCHDDGTEVTLTPGMWHYCPQGHSHSVRHTGTEPLVIRAVLPRGQTGPPNPRLPTQQG